MIPISAAFFNSLMTSSIHLWTRQLSRTPCMALFLWINLGTGRSMRSIKAWFNTFIQKSMTISTRLMRSRWATQLPVITKILVLSDNFKVPIVSPNSSCTGKIDFIWAELFSQSSGSPIMMVSSHWWTILAVFLWLVIGAWCNADQSKSWQNKKTYLPAMHSSRWLPRIPRMSFCRTYCIIIPFTGTSSQWKSCNHMHTSLNSSQCL